jgi:hypothetical protein
MTDLESKDAYVLHRVIWAPLSKAHLPLKATQGQGSHPYLAK